MTFTDKPILIAVAFVAIAAACDGSGGASKIADPQLRAKTLWSARCAACHGATGLGDGEATPGIRITPTDLTDPTWQRGVTDARIAKVIVEGGGSIGLSHVMSPNPDLADDPKAVDALVKIVRALEVPTR